MFPGPSAALLATLLALGVSASAAAQGAVTPDDIRRLQDRVFEAGTDLSRLRTGDAILLTQLRPELDDLRDEVVYLKVKLRKHEPITRTEYEEVRDRIEAVSRRARGPDTVNAAGLGPGAVAPPPATPHDGVTLPAATELEVRLATAFDADRVSDDRFEAVTARDVSTNGRVVIPTGSLLRGTVIAAGVLFDRLTVGYRTYTIRATVPAAPRRARAGTVLRVRLDAAVTIYRDQHN